ncbi:MAG: hypothetical protein ACRCVX_11950 [Shewanella sp.]
MQKTNSQRLDELLIAWHQAYNHTGRAYPTVASGCTNSLTSKQYDTETTTHYDNLDAGDLSDFSDFMDTLHEDRCDYYRALCEDARNLYFGVEVYRNPLLPKGEAMRHLLGLARSFAIREFLGS